ncbi:MAG: hypothetical protein JNK67_10680 [Alphaproteobacteria bacterium]|nr:hypothetical protein [Alphaproteobacteria bacterium]
MTDKLNQTTSAAGTGKPDMSRRRLFKTAVKGAAVGAPLIITLRGGNAWAASCTAAAGAPVAGAPVALVSSSCITSSV